MEEVFVGGYMLTSLGPYGCCPGQSFVRKQIDELSSFHALRDPLLACEVERALQHEPIASSRVAEILLGLCSERHDSWGVTVGGADGVGVGAQDCVICKVSWSVCCCCSPMMRPRTTSTWGQLTLPTASMICRSILSGMQVRTQVQVDRFKHENNQHYTTALLNL